MLMTIGKNMILSFQRPIVSQFYLSTFKCMASHDKNKKFTRKSRRDIGLAEFFWSSFHCFIFWWAALLSFCRRWPVFLHWNNVKQIIHYKWLHLSIHCWSSLVLVIKVWENVLLLVSAILFCFLFLFVCLFHFVEFKKPLNFTFRI